MLTELESVGRISDFFRAYRAKHDYSQRKLAKLLGVQSPYIAKTELGELQLPTELCRKLYGILTPNEKADLIDAIKADHKLQLKRILETLDQDKRRF